LDAWAKAEIAQVPKAKRKIITSHDGFQYLGKVYGIKLVPARGWVNDRAVSADDLARLVRQIRQDNVRAIFVENMNDPRVIERVAQETGAVIGGTLYSDALSKPGGEAGTYLKMMRHNIETLKAGDAEETMAWFSGSSAVLLGAQRRIALALVLVALL
jgi:zinc/manganese transport system substrate-binding protein